MDTIQTLTQLGLSDKEARVYLALLETGPASAYSIALRARVKKPTVYFVMEQLIEKALVARVTRKRKQLYVARPPEELERLERARLRRIERIMPELQALAHGALDAGVRTLVFEGVRGMEQAYYYRIDELNDSKLLGFYGSALDVTSELNNIIKEWNVYLVRHRISTRAIVPKHSSLAEYRKLDKEHQRTVKIVPYEAYSSDVSIEITPLFVRIGMYKDMQSLIIESSKIVTVMRQIFELSWNNLSLAKQVAK